MEADIGIQYSEKSEAKAKVNETNLPLEKNGTEQKQLKTMNRIFSRLYSSRCTIPTTNSVLLVSESFNAKGFVQKDKRNILFLHGFLGSKKNYRTLGRQISRAGYNVMGVDLRNHGESQHALPLDYLSLASDVQQYIESANLSNVVIIGHLMGAKTAMIVALQNPKLVSGLIVVDNTPSYTRLDDSFRHNLQALTTIEDLKIPSDSLSKDVKARMNTVFEQYGISSNVVRTFLLSNVQKAGHHITFANPNSCFVENNAIDVLSEWPGDMVAGKYDGPVLVVRSTQSGFIPTLDPFQRYFSDFTLVDFDASHYIITEKGKEFTELALQYLNDTRRQSDII